MCFKGSKEVIGVGLDFRKPSQVSGLFLLALLLFCSGGIAGETVINDAKTAKQTLGESDSLKINGTGSISVSNDSAVMGSDSNEGGNIITLESGAEIKITKTSANEDNYYGIKVNGTKRDDSKVGLAGGGSLEDGASNIIILKPGSKITTTGSNPTYPYMPGIRCYLNNSITANGEIITTGKGSYGIDLNNRNNVLTVGGSITTSGEEANGVHGSSPNNHISVSGTISTTGDSACAIYGSMHNNITMTGTLNTTGDNADGIKGKANYGMSSTINASGTITTTGRRSHGIDAEAGNVAGACSMDITASGNITTEGNGSYGITLDAESSTTASALFSGTIETTGEQAAGICGEKRTVITVTPEGRITTSGENADGVKIQDYNTLTMKGSITTTGNSNGTPWHLRCGISAYRYNNIISTGSIKVSGDKVDAVDCYETGNAAYLSGMISATGEGGYALTSGNAATGDDDDDDDDDEPEVNAFHLLSGVSLTGSIHNRDSDANGISYLSFGYAKTADGKADFTKVDKSFSLMCTDSITSNSSKGWMGYFAGGEVTLNGETNNIWCVFIGAASFPEEGMTKIPDGNDGNGSKKELDALPPVAGASATLKIGKSLKTTNGIKIGAGSTLQIAYSDSQKPDITAQYIDMTGENSRIVVECSATGTETVTVVDCGANNNFRTSTTAGFYLTGPTADNYVLELQDVDGNAVALGSDTIAKLVIKPKTITSADYASMMDTTVNDASPSPSTESINICCSFVGDANVPGSSEAATAFSANIPSALISASNITNTTGSTTSQSAQDLSNNADKIEITESASFQIVDGALVKDGGDATRDTYQATISGNMDSGKITIKIEASSSDDAPWSDLQGIELYSRCAWIKAKDNSVVTYSNYASNTSSITRFSTPKSPTYTADSKVIPTTGINGAVQIGSGSAIAGINSDAGTGMQEVKPVNAYIYDFSALPPLISGGNGGEVSVNGALLAAALPGSPTQVVIEFTEDAVYILSSVNITKDQDLNSAVRVYLPGDSGRTVFHISHDGTQNALARVKDTSEFTPVGTAGENEFGQYFYDATNGQYVVNVKKFSGVAVGGATGGDSSKSGGGSSCELTTNGSIGSLLPVLLSLLSLALISRKLSKS